MFEEDRGNGEAASTPASETAAAGHKRKAIAETASDSPDLGPQIDDKQYLEVDWQSLRGLNVQTGEASPLVELAIGANIRVPGFLVPFDDGLEETSEFLIVPQAGMCVHTPAPPPNQMILAQASGRPVKMTTGAVWISGRLELQSSASPYGATAYHMSAEFVRPAR